jgi:peptidoglycan hydrolase FlgJ
MDNDWKAVNAATPPRMTALPNEGREKPKLDEEKLKKACKDFEAIFINKLIKNMRATVPKSALLDGGSQKEVYLSMFDEELSKNLAAKGGIGLGKILQRNLSQRVPPPKGDEAGANTGLKSFPPKNPKGE